MVDPVEGMGSTVRVFVGRRRRYPTHRSAMAPAMGHAILVQALRLMQVGLGERIFSTIPGSVEM